MVAGETVSGVSAENTALTVQPAATVELVITLLTMDDQAVPWELTDGVLYSKMFADNQAVSFPEFVSSSTKVFLTNSVYMHIDTVGAGNSSGYTGLQIK